LIANYSPSDYDADWYKAHRAGQLYELVRHVDSTSAANSYTIVMGDLNTQPVEDSYKAIIRGRQLYTPNRMPLRNIWRDISKSSAKKLDEAMSPLSQTNPDQWSTTTMLMSHQNGRHFTCNLRTNSYYKSWMPEQQIDHILYVPDGRIRCVDASIFLTHPTRDPSGQSGPSYSDHSAVMATFRINPAHAVKMNNKKSTFNRKNKGSHPATQKLMIRLNEDIQGIESQRWAYKFGAFFTAFLCACLLAGGVLFLRKANDTDELQKRLSIANAPDKYKWYEKISYNWYALACLVVSIFFALYCQGLVVNAIVFLPQELFAFKELQYEWALWLRKH